MTTFTLPRILDAAPAAAKPPDIGQAPDDRLESVPVRFHPRLTDDQRLALAHKLRILGGCVTLPRRGVFEFMRDCVAIFGKTFWDLPVTKRSQKLATSSAFGGPRSSCVRHACVLRFATHSGTAPTNDLTPCRLPYV